MTPLPSSGNYYELCWWQSILIFKKFTDWVRYQVDNFFTDKPFYIERIIENLPTHLPVGVGIFLKAKPLNDMCKLSPCNVHKCYRLNIAPCLPTNFTYFLRMRRFICVSEYKRGVATPSRPSLCNTIWYRNTLENDIWIGIL